MADTAGTSDLVFGLFWLLGYQFSPRIADIGGVRLWRMDTEADYGPLNGLARNRINSNLITDHWDDMLLFSRVAAISLPTNLLVACYEWV